MEELILKDKFLLNACSSCVLKSGNPDDELVKKLFNHIYDKYVAKGKGWTTQLIERLIVKWHKQAC